MNKIHPVIVQFFYNFTTDYILLLLITKDLFPEKKQTQIIKAAVIFSVTYIIWEGMATEIPIHLKLLLKWTAVILLLCLFFKIHSIRLFFKTMVSFMLWLFLMAGSLSFFLNCIQIEQITVEKEACKAMLILLILTGNFLLWKRRRNQKNHERKSQENTYEVQIVRKGKKVICRGIYDSGNLLTSQITGQGVCIINQEESLKLLSPEEQKKIIKFPEKSAESISWKIWTRQFQSGIYLLQYSSVGKEHAIMPGIMAEQIVVLKNKEVLAQTKGMLGIRMEKFSEKHTFSVLLPADIFERENNRSII